MAGAAVIGDGYNASGRGAFCFCPYPMVDQDFPLLFLKLYFQGTPPTPHHSHNYDRPVGIATFKIGFDEFGSEVLIEAQQIINNQTCPSQAGPTNTNGGHGNTLGHFAQRHWECPQNHAENTGIPKAWASSRICSCPLCLFLELKPPIM